MGENFVEIISRARKKKKKKKINGENRATENHSSQKKFKLTPLHAYGKYYITKCKGKRKITYNGRKRNRVRIRVRAPCRFSSSSGRDLGVSTFWSDPREAFVSNETSSFVVAILHSEALRSNVTLRRRSNIRTCPFWIR